MKFSLAFVSAATVLAASGFGIAVSAAPALSPRTVTTNIAFVGFCDGMKFNIDKNNALTENTFVMYGNRTGCSSDPIGGSEGRVAGPERGTITATFASTPTEVNFVYIIKKAGTWCNYQVTPTTISKFLCGTWRSGVPSRAAKSLRSTTEQ